MTTAEPAPPPDDESHPAAVPAGRSSRSLRDMALSIGVLIIPLVLLIAFCRPGSRDVPTVDPGNTYRAAAAAGAFPVRVPELPSGWRASNAALRSAAAGRLTLRVSYLTPTSRFAQLIESSVAADTLISDEIGESRPQGTVRIGGADWQRYDGRRAGETALVLLEPQVTVLIVGDATAAEQRVLAESLR